MTMENVRVVSNHNLRDPVFGCEFTGKLREKMRAEFDYRDEQDFDSTRFVKYRGEWYDLCDTAQLPPGPLREMGWSEYVDGSAWHCVVFTFVYFEGDLLVKVGNAYWD